MIYMLIYLILFNFCKFESEFFYRSGVPDYNIHTYIHIHLCHVFVDEQFCGDIPARINICKCYDVILDHDVIISLL